MMMKKRLSRIMTTLLSVHYEDGMLKDLIAALDLNYIVNMKLRLTKTIKYYL